MYASYTGDAWLERDVRPHTWRGIGEGTGILPNLATTVDEKHPHRYREEAYLSQIRYALPRRSSGRSGSARQTVLMYEEVLGMITIRYLKFS